MSHLPTLTHRISTCLRDNEAAMGKLDRVDRGRLLPFTDRLRHVLHRIETAHPAELRDLETYLGANMHGPEVDRWISQCEAIRAGVESSSRRAA